MADPNEISDMYQRIKGILQQPERCSFSVYTEEGGLYQVFRTNGMIKALDEDSLTLLDFSKESDFVGLGTLVHIEFIVEGDVPINYYFNAMVRHEVFWRHPEKEIPLID